MPVRMNGRISVAVAASIASLLILIASGWRVVAESPKAVDTVPPTSDEARGKAWWAHVQYLADPSMNGRLTGSPEYLKAAAYVVEKFKSEGLQPAGVNSTYYQPVRFDVTRVIAEKSSMSLVTAGKTEPLVLGTDAIVRGRLAKGEAPVVYINGGPAELPTALKSYARTAPLAKALRDAGAVGTISIPTPKSMDFGWQRVASGAGQPRMQLAEDPAGA